MRIAGILAAISFLTQTAGAEEAFPYAATIAQEAVLVRSGPGEGFYSTCRLLKGAEVEVHRHGPNGWCAIRPTEGEFSLIAADAVKLLPGDDLLEVLDQEAAVWVGSRVAKPEQHRWQIHLQPGECAAVLGVRAGAGEDGNPVTWYKIAPPAGEFRWIPIETLTREKLLPGDETPPQELPADVVASAAPLAEAPAAGEVLDASRSDELPMPAGDQTVVEDPSGIVAQALLEEAIGNQPPLTPIPDEAIQMAPAELDPDADPPFMEADLRIEPRPRTPREEDATQAAPVDVAASETVFDTEATALQVDLTLAVAQDLSRWRLGPLRDRAVRLRDNSPSPDSRREAEKLLASIAHFEQLYDRYLRYAQLRGAARSRPRVIASEVQSLPRPADDEVRR